MLLLHQLGVSCQNRFPINHGLYAVTGNFLNIGNPAVVDFLSIGVLDRKRNRVVGVVLSVCGQLQKLRFLHADRVDLADRKGAFCQCAGLIKDHDLGICQGLQIVAALYQNTDLGCAADASEETKRNGNDQRTGAGNHQEGQGPVNPSAEWLLGNQRRQDRQRQSSEYHYRGIIPGKARDEILNTALLIACVFYKVKDFGYGGFPKFLCGLDVQDTGLVDTTADDLHSRLHLAGHGFSGQGRSVQGGKAFENRTVQRDALSRFHNNGFSDLNLIRVNLNQLSVPFDVGIVRANVHQACDRFSGLGHRIGLEPFTHLIKQHNGNALGMFAQNECADGGNRHQEIFVKHLSMQDVRDCLPDNIPTDNHIADEKDRHLRQFREVEQAACKKQHRRHDNACEQVPLFSCHSVFSFRCSIKRVTLFLSIDEKHRLPCGSRCPAFHYALTVTSGSICLISAFASARTASN